MSGAGQRGAWRRWGLFRVGYRPARASLPIGSSPTMLRPPILRQSRDEGGGMPSSTRTNMASALAASMLATTMGSGRCCASGSVRNGASRRISFRFVPAPFSQCTTCADAATPCLAPSSQAWLRDGPATTLEPNKSLLLLKSASYAESVLLSRTLSLSANTRLGSVGICMQARTLPLQWRSSPGKR